MLAQSIAATGGVPRRFLRSFAWRLRFWFLGLPAGVGLATLRSILKLWLFIPPEFSGVRSAGNGPAMRSAILGVCFADSDPLLVMHNSAATTITHRDPPRPEGRDRRASRRAGGARVDARRFDNGLPGGTAALREALRRGRRRTRRARRARRAALAAATRTPQGALFLAPWWWLLRNLVFMVIVLAHGFRRLGPPW